MKKFILIDHSIRKYGGHYFEYALHVLRAARELGYHPILATNRSLDLSEEEKKELGFEIYPIYKYDFWGISNEMKDGFNLFKKIKKSYNKLLFKIKFRLYYSDMGILWLARNNPEEYLSGQSYNLRTLVIKGLLLMPLVYFLALARGIKRFIEAAYMIVKGSWIGTLTRAFFELLKSLVLPINFINRNRNRLLSRMHKISRIKAFERGTRKLCSYIELHSDDIVFIPTLSEYDMLGIGEFFKSEQNSTRATWHLLYRRNIFVGREAEYENQKGNVQSFRKMLIGFRERTGNLNIKFYTDTDKLTYQYNELHAVPFLTLPIPVNNDFFKTLDQYKRDRPLRVVYAGDARSEKGYQLLPSIVRNLYQNYVMSEKIEFIFQSNFSFKQFEYQASVVYAREQLMKYEKGVSIIKEPLKSEEYKDLVLSADVGLVLYDRDNYYARSSGALVEYLTCGIPVIVPSGSWMSDQITEEIFSYNDSLKQKMCLVKQYQMSDLEWRKEYELLNELTLDVENLLEDEIRDTKDTTDKKKIPKTFNNELIVWGNSRKTSCKVDREDTANYLFISYRQGSENKKGSYVRVILRQYDNNCILLKEEFTSVGNRSKGDISTVFSLEEKTAFVIVSLSNAFSEYGLLLRDVELEFYNSVEKTFPISSVGVIYDRLEDIPERLIEVIENYEHYKSTSQKFSLAWRELHNPNKLVRQLINNSNVIERV
ncbi:hypothetical protein [Heliomicrobium modesticaldum]|nr:hypothetical protein [Heliomicrobium modesticaldum]